MLLFFGLGFSIDPSHEIFSSDALIEQVIVKRFCFSAAPRYTNHTCCSILIAII